MRRLAFWWRLANRPFERELKSVREKIENLKTKLAIAKKIQKQVALARKIRSAVQVYENKLQNRKLAELEDFTSQMYKRLARKQDFVGEVKIDLRTFDVAIHDTEGRVKEKRSLSAGEKQIYAIALLWGLAKSSDVELPIIIDTPFARLDSEHRTNIARHYFPFASEQVIILSTDEEIDQRSHHHDHQQQSRDRQIDTLNRPGTVDGDNQPEVRLLSRKVEAAL